MSEVEELQNEIIVYFNNNDTFSKIKNKVQEIESQVQEIEDKPKPKRKSTKKIIAEQVEAVETVEDIKPKPKRKPTKKISIEETEEQVEAVEDIEDIKPKPKRKPSKKITIEDLKPEPEPVPVEEAPKQNIKTLEQVECPKCEKPMTKTTLRYHHDKTCPGEKVNKEEKPVKKRVVKDKTPEVIEPITYKERLNQNIKIKQESIKKLAANIA